MLWGVYFGVLLVLEKLFLLKLLKKLPTVLRHIYALLLITLSWTLFAFTDISAGFAWLGSMFSGILFDSDSVYLLLTLWPDAASVCVRSNAHRQAHVRLAEQPFEAGFACRRRLRRNAVRAYRSGGVSCERQL